MAMTDPAPQGDRRPDRLDKAERPGAAKLSRLSVGQNI